MPVPARVVPTAYRAFHTVDEQKTTYQAWLELIESGKGEPAITTIYYLMKRKS